LVKSILNIARAWALLLMVGPGVVAQSAADPQPIRLIEVFTTQDAAVTGTRNINSHPVVREATVEVYTVDGIARFESRLSRNLPVDPRQAERIVLKRLQQRDAGSRRQLQHAATGLARASQYGVDRLPAIVFDGRWVVYGVTDLATARSHLHSWQVRSRP